MTYCQSDIFKVLLCRHVNAPYDRMSMQTIDTVFRAMKARVEGMGRREGRIHYYLFSTVQSMCKVKHVELNEVTTKHKQES